MPGVKALQKKEESAFGTSADGVSRNTFNVREPGVRSGQPMPETLWGGTGPIVGDSLTRENPYRRLLLFPTKAIILSIGGTCNGEENRSGDG
jgi:hypothetical protein